MKAWGYALIVLACLLPFWVAANRAAIRGAAARLRLYFAVKRQLFYFTGYAFEQGGELYYIDYLVITPDGVHAVFVHDIGGKITGRGGRIYWSAKSRGRERRFFNPVPHDVRAVNALNAFVPESAQIIPALVFPRGNGGEINAMWITPAAELINSFNADGDDDGCWNVYDALDEVRLTGKLKRRAKAQARGFIKRRCPVCGKRLKDGQTGEKTFIRCSDENCAFVRNFLPQFKDDDNEINP